MSLAPAVDDADPRLVGSDRVLAVLTHLARHPDGISLDELAALVDSPKPTVHRALVSLRRAGLAQSSGHGQYLLGDEFLRLAFQHHEARPDHVRIVPVLERLAERYGETAHYAVLDSRDIVYRSKVDPAEGAVRLTSTVGGRNPAHTTAVGKLLLAHRLPDLEAVEGWVAAAPLPRLTPRTLDTAAALHADFERIRDRGFAVDDQENEAGINCLAVPAYLTSAREPSGAVSVSAVAFRTPLARLVDEVDAIRRIVAGDDAGEGEEKR